MSPAPGKLTRLCIAVRLPALLCSLALIYSSSAGADDPDWREHYRQGRLDRAHAVLAEALAEDPDDPELLAWMAAVLSRQQLREQALAYADRALQEHRCRSLAHWVKAELLNPQLGSESDRSYDAVWQHGWRSVECDPGFGPGWLLLWNEAARRGEGQFETEAVKGVYLSKMFTPAAMEFARWMLESLPKHAVLITNGDLDTYPLWVDQVVHFRRQDVKVVNYPLLNSDWYPAYVEENYRLPMPEDNQHPEAESWAEKSILSWLDDPALGPVVFAVTLDAPIFMDRDDLQLAGGFYLTGNYEGSPVDTGATISSLKRVDLGKMKGPMTGEQDLSPVRVTGADAVKNNMLYAALQCGIQLTEEGRREAALDILKWAEELNRYTPDLDGYESAAAYIRGRESN